MAREGVAPKAGFSGAAATAPRVARPQTISVDSLKRSHNLSPGFVQYGFLCALSRVGCLAGNAGPTSQMAPPRPSFYWAMPHCFVAGLRTPSSLLGQQEVRGPADRFRSLLPA